MASFKITDLTELVGGSVADTDVLEIVDLDADQSKKVTIASLKTVFSASEGSAYTGGTSNGIMFNDGDTFATDGGVKFDSTTNTLTVGESGNNGVIELMRSSGGTRMGYLGAQNSGLWIGLDYNFGKSHIWFDNATKTVTIGNGGTSLGAALGVANTTDIVAHRIDLSNGQTEDAFQINSFGNTGGDLFRVDADGALTLANTTHVIGDGSGGGRIDFRSAGFGSYIQSNGYDITIRGRASNGGGVLIGGTSSATDLEISRDRYVKFYNIGTPTSPDDGAMWYDGTDFKVRLGGVTRTLQVV